MNFKDPIIAKSSVKNGNKIQPIGKLCCYVHTMKYTKRILSLTVQTASEKEKERKRAENFRPVFRSDRSRAQLGKICEYETLLEEITIAPAISPLFSFFSQKYRELCRLKARPARRAESTKTTTTIAVTMDEPVSKCQTNPCNLLCRFDTFPREAHYRYLFFNIIIIRDIFLDEERIMDLSRRELNLFIDLDLMKYYYLRLTETHVLFFMPRTIHIFLIWNIIFLRVHSFKNLFFLIL